MSSKNNQKVLEIFFDGATWKMHKEQSDMILSYANLLKGIPELMSFIQGFLCNDYHTIFRSYFVTFLMIWVSASLHPTFTISLLVFFCYIMVIFAEQKAIDYDIEASDPALFIALNIYFTYRRIFVYMSLGKGVLALFVVAFIFLSCKPPIFAIIVPSLISSLLIRTEQSVSRMRISLTKC